MLAKKAVKMFNHKLSKLIKPKKTVKPDCNNSLQWLSPVHEMSVTSLIIMGVTKGES